MEKPTPGRSQYKVKGPVFTETAKAHTDVALLPQNQNKGQRFPAIQKRRELNPNFKFQKL